MAKWIYFTVRSIYFMIKSIDLAAQKGYLQARQSGGTKYKFLILRSLQKMAQFPKAEADVSALAVAKHLKWEMRVGY